MATNLEISKGIDVWEYSSDAISEEDVRSAGLAYWWSWILLNIYFPSWDGMHAQKQADKAQEKLEKLWIKSWMKIS